MSTRVWIAGIVVIAGCAMQPLRGTLPVKYDCAGRAAIGLDGSLSVDGEEATPIAAETDGRHFLLGRGDDLVEYVVVDDPRIDIMTMTYDAAAPRDRATWKLRGRGTCIARAGFTEALTRFMAGKTPDEIAVELDLPRPEAERLIHGAIAYYRARLEY